MEFKKLVIFILILQGQLIYSAEKRKIESLDNDEITQEKKQKTEKEQEEPFIILWPKVQNRSFRSCSNIG